MLSQALQARYITPEIKRRAEDKTQDELDRANEDAAEKALGDDLSSLDTLSLKFGEDLSHSFDTLITSGANFTRVIDGLLVKLGEMIVQIEIFKPLAESFGGAGGGLFGSLFTGLAGAMAGGGDVSYGQSYLIGEEGPEIFTPSMSGSITPNSALGPGSDAGGGLTVNVDARGADAAAEYRARKGVVAGLQQASVNGYLLSREMARRGA
jgi:hypothetical protein